MKLNILKFALASLPLVAFSACMDYDEPFDEYNQETNVEISPEPLFGDADALEIREVLPEDSLKKIIRTLNLYFGQLSDAQYYLMGSKNGTQTDTHQYQYIYSLTTDNYAGYTTCDQSWSGSFETTYSIKTDFCEGPHGRLLSMKNDLANFLNDSLSNEVVEIKAIALLMFDHVAQECTDLYGAIAYQDHKGNKQENPFTFNDGYTIYASILNNLDSIVAVFDNFPNRPDYYQKQINQILTLNDKLTIQKTIDAWKRYANSLKLRMAMHLVKVNPEDARRYAEEAVKSGVIETMEQQVGINNQSCYCFDAHPIVQIFSGWNDARINASFVSMLMSLRHPYTYYMLGKNSNDLVEGTTGEVVAKDSMIVGLRAGIRMENGQQYYANPRVAYSQFIGQDFEYMPLYAMKWAEVDFLRAEGALRGWDMGGSAQFFYERGIDNADCGNCFGDTGTDNYAQYVEAYKNVESAVPYTSVDPMDHNNDIESVTKIGVKWNDGDDPETKLEKIITQKYIAIFPYSYEAWTDMRRTGYPKIFPVLNPQLGDGSLRFGDLIRRMTLPHGDLPAGHEDIETSGLEALGGPDQQATRVFWDREDVPNF